MHLDSASLFQGLWTDFLCVCVCVSFALSVSVSLFRHPCVFGGGGDWKSQGNLKHKGNVIIDMGGHYSKMASDAVLRQ